MGLAANSGYAIDCTGGKQLHKDQDIELYLAPLNMDTTLNTVSLYRLKQQPLTFVFCVKSRTETPITLDISVCDKNCSEHNARRLDTRVQASWHKNAYASKSVRVNRKDDTVLIPELLIHDQRLLRRANGESAIRTLANGREHYITGSEYETLQDQDRHGRIHQDASRYSVKDSNQLESVTLIKQATFFVYHEGPIPDSAVYVEITRNDKSTQIEVPLETIDTTLQPAKLVNGIYYRGVLGSDDEQLSSEWKTADQLKDDFSTMINLGILYPTVYIYSEFYRYMAVRNEQPFPKDSIYIIDSKAIQHLKAREWGKYKRRLQYVSGSRSFSQYATKYFYLVDEPDGKTYEAVINAAASIAQEVGVRLFLAGRHEVFREHIVKGVTYVVAYTPSADISRSYHQGGAQILSYANPQIGVYTPTALRENYGFTLIKFGVDGMMPYAYQDIRGSQWSDMDGKYRDHMLTYPVTGGHLLTIHAFQLREAVIDQRFYLTLEHSYQSYLNSCRPTTPLPPPTSVFAKARSPNEQRLYIARLLTQIALITEHCESLAA